MATIDHSRAAEEGPSSAAPADLDALNAVTLNMAQLSAARQILGQLADELRWDGSARRAALRAELDDPDIAIDAIDARLLAVRKWEDLHDPERVLSQLHLMEAATLAPLIDTDHGVGFRDTTFRELVDFIAELPW